MVRSHGVGHAFLQHAVLGDGQPNRSRTGCRSAKQQRPRRKLGHKPPMVGFGRALCAMVVRAGIVYSAAGLRAAPWPNGYGISLRSRGLQVRVLPGSSFQAATPVAHLDTLRVLHVWRRSRAISTPPSQPRDALTKRLESDTAGVQTPAGRAYWISSPSR